MSMAVFKDAQHRYLHLNRCWYICHIAHLTNDRFYNSCLNNLQRPQQDDFTVLDFARKIIFRPRTHDLLTQIFLPRHYPPRKDLLPTDLLLCHCVASTSSVRVAVTKTTSAVTVVTVVTQIRRSINPPDLVQLKTYFA